MDMGKEIPFTADRYIEIRSKVAALEIVVATIHAEILKKANNPKKRWEFEKDASVDQSQERKLSSLQDGEELDAAIYGEFEKHLAEHFSTVADFLGIPKDER